MIPTINKLLSSELETQLSFSQNYRMDFDQMVISGFCDELDAMRQVVFKILNTERYEYLIYSKAYGIELGDLFGEPIAFVCLELQRRITEALLQDDRIEEVDSFLFDSTHKGSVQVSFVVHTIFGDLTAERRVTVS